MVESMCTNIVGDALLRYIAAASEKILLHYNNVVSVKGIACTLPKPLNGQEGPLP